MPDNPTFGRSEGDVPLRPIADDTGQEIRNRSGISHNMDKWAHSVPQTVPLLPDGWHMTDRYQERYNGQDGEALAEWIGPWSSRMAFYEWVLGYSWTIPREGNEGRLRRVPPCQHPELPWLYGDEVSLIEGQGAPTFSPDALAMDGGHDDDGIATFIVNGNGTFNELPMVAFVDNVPNKPSDGLARVKVTYRDRMYEVRTDQEIDRIGTELARYVIRERTYAIQALALSKLATAGSNQLKFAENPPGATSSFIGQAIPEAGIILLPTMSLKYTWKEVPDIPEALIADVLGTVNNEPFDGLSGSRSFDAETLLCQPPIIKRYRNKIGHYTHDITYTFDFRPDGWNRFPTPGGQGFALATFGGDTTGRRVYSNSDFTLLFEVPAPVTYQ